MRCLPAAFVHSLTGGHQHPSIKSWSSSTPHRPIKNQKRLVRPVRVYAETCEKRVHEYVGNADVCQHLRVQVYRKLAAASTHAPAPRQKRIPVVYTKASLGHIRTNLMCASFVGTPGNKRRHVHSHAPTRLHSGQMAATPVADNREPFKLSKFKNVPSKWAPVIWSNHALRPYHATGIHTWPPQHPVTDRVTNTRDTGGAQRTYSSDGWCQQRQQQGFVHESGRRDSGQQRATP